MAFTYEKRILYLYTDGSQKSKPRKGGIGIVFVYVDGECNLVKEEIPRGGYVGVTNNEMELQAVIEALKIFIRKKYFLHFEKAIVITDSMYVVGNVNNAKFYWIKNGWRNRDHKPIDNVDKWKELLRLLKKLDGYPVRFEWVKGHGKDAFNRAADDLADKSAKAAYNPPLKVRTVGRKLSNKQTKSGSIRIAGQEMKIHVIETMNMGYGRGYKHRYELLDTSDPDYGCIDWIYTDELVVWARHCFRVRVNEDKNYPKIIEVFEELDNKTGMPKQVEKGINE